MNYLYFVLFFTGVINWRSTNLDYTHKYPNPMILPEGKISIMVTGRYVLYGMFTITSGEGLEQPDVITHYIIREYYDSSNKIQRSVVLLNRATERPQNQFACQTSFLYGESFLRRGDMVYTFVSNASAVYQFPPTNYWGLYMYQ